jgi:GTP-binding protein Era
MSEPKRNENDDFRAGYVAIVGEPNVGKSTLINALLDLKISIVTPKPQTTRRRVLGILNGSGYQAVFLDTPGILKPKYLLQKAMVETAYSAIDDADLVLAMIEAGSSHVEHDQKWDLVLDSVKRSGKPSFLLINKIDLVQRAELLPIIDRFSTLTIFKEIVPVSALKGENVDELKSTLVRHLPVGERYFPPDAITDQPEKFFVAEIIREKVFEKYRDEVPYSSEVEVVEFKEREGKKDFVSAEVCVERESQKGILIGKGGAALKEVGERARKDIEEFLGRSVFLELRVKVRQNWRKDQRWLKRLGYGGR